jgi:two-component system response regulator RegA
MNPLLLVEDDARLRRGLTRSLEHSGFVVTEAVNLMGALALCGCATYTHAVVDLRLPDGSGLEVVTALVKKSPQARIIVLSGWGSIATAVEAVRRGAADFLAKPVAPAQLTQALLGIVPEAPTPATADQVPSLDRVEWEHIQRVLSETDNNVSEAARRLGLHRRSLQRKLGKRPPSR